MLTATMPAMAIAGINRTYKGHRLLEAHGVRSFVVDPSSIAVNRRSRRAELPKVLPAPAGGMATEGRLKEWRAVATRYKKTANSFMGVLCLAAAIDWIKC